MTPFKLNIGKKMLKFRKVTSANFKIGKLSIAWATSNFQELFVNKCKSLSEGIYYEKALRGAKMPRVK